MKSAQLSILADQLKTARERKGLSQRALAEKVGLPQGHISRIERAAVDLQTSNLLQIARALDLELVLVPRKALPAIEALSRKDSVDETLPGFEYRAQLNSLLLQSRRLARTFPQTPVLDRLIRTLSELHELSLALPAKQLGEFRAALLLTGRLMREMTSHAKRGPLDSDSIREAERLERALRSARNAIVHGQVARPGVVPSAYALDDEESDDG
jgi:transcriptional regulator with XRE-family HTH domain